MRVCVCACSWVKGAVMLRLRFGNVQRDQCKVAVLQMICRCCQWWQKGPLQQPLRPGQHHVQLQLGQVQQPPLPLLPWLTSI